jgi:hypothetical protein
VATRRRVAATQIREESVDEVKIALLIHEREEGPLCLIYIASVALITQQ